MTETLTAELEDLQEAQDMALVAGALLHDLVRSLMDAASREQAAEAAYKLVGVIGRWAMA